MTSLIPHLTGLWICQRHLQGSFQKNVSKMFAGDLNFLACLTIYQNSHRVVVGVSNSSQFSFRGSQSARNARQLRERLLTYETKLWPSGDKNEKLTFWSQVPEKTNQKNSPDKLGRGTVCAIPIQCDSNWKTVTNCHAIFCLQLVVSSERWYNWLVL